LKLTKTISSKIKSELLKYDPNIVEIIQFGSSVYAPKYAWDIDLLIFTKNGQDYIGYLDCLDGLNLPFGIDIIVKKDTENLKKAFAIQLFGAYKILYGSGDYLLESMKMINPDYKEAKTELKIGRDIFKLGVRTKDKLKKDHLFRNAFNNLFHGARVASMVYLAINEKRWGEVKKKLPNPYKEEFERYISILHVKYFYDGNYPKDKVKEEFELWYNKVQDYIKNLEKQS